MTTQFQVAVTTPPPARGLFSRFLGAEVEAALGKLAGAGLVRVYDDWTFELTDEGAEVWSGDGRDLRSHLAAVLASLSAREPERIAVRLPKDAMDQAVAAYREATLDQ